MTATIDARAVKLILDDDSEYNFSPLSDEQWSELDTWAQAQVIRAARIACEGAGPRERAEILQAAAKAAPEVQWSTISNTREANAQMLLRSLQNHHPDITLAECVAMVRSPFNQRAVLDAFLNVNYSGSGGSRKEINPQNNGG